MFSVYKHYSVGVSCKSQLNGVGKAVETSVAAQVKELTGIVDVLYAVDDYQMLNAVLRSYLVHSKCLIERK